MLSEEEVARIRDIIEQDHKIEGDLRKEINVNIKRLMDIGCYRGLRHRKGLAGARSEDENEFADEERTAQDLYEEKEVRGRNGEGAKDRQEEGKEEYSYRRGAYTVELQQYDHYHSGPPGKRDFVVERRHSRF